MNVLYGLLAFAIGMATNLQSSVNGQLRTVTGNPAFASTVNFAVGTLLLIVLLVVCARRGQYPFPRRDVLRQTSWWMWSGGPLGVLYVMGGVLLPPVIGYGAFFSMLVAGQLLFSVAIDHFGWFSTLVTPLNKRRALGLLLLVVGALLVQNT